MNSKNDVLKKIVAQIQKEGLAPPPLSTGEAPPASGGAAAPVVRAPQSGAYMTPAGIPQVREMQRAMKELADAVMRDAQSQTMAYKPKDALQPSATQSVAAAKKGFNDFIAEQYLGGLDENKKGVEWTTDKSVTTHPGKTSTQTDIYELDVVMDTLRRIGLSSGEFKEDGIWSFRTNNALKNIMGFAYALLELEGDFGLKNNSYNLRNWKDLSKLLSDYTATDKGISLNKEQQAEKAEKITKHLKAITKLYDQFRLQITARPELRPLLEGKRAFEKYDTTGTDKDVLTQQESELIKSNMEVSGLRFNAPGLPGGVATSIPLSALTDKTQFEKYLQSIGWTEENLEGIAPKLFKVIKQQIEAK